MEAAGERDGRGVKKFCKALAGHLEQYFSYCIKPKHPEFDAVYISAMFLDPYLSQMLSEQEEELALDFLKTRAYLSDKKEDHSGSSGSAIFSACGTGTAEGGEVQEDGPSLPKRLHLFKFVKISGRQHGLSDGDFGFSTRFGNDIQRVRNLFRPLR
jgi:hypothetical protein